MGGGKIPGQCVRYSQIREGTYNCLDRNDEDPFSETVTIDPGTPPILLSNLVSCKVEKHGYGLNCGGESGCVLMKRWCKSFFFIFYFKKRWCKSGKRSCFGSSSWCKDKPALCPILGDGILTNNPQICSNISFWRQWACNEGEIQCGAQCFKREEWGDLDRPLKENCKDGSDSYRPIRQTSVNQEPHVWKVGPLSKKTNLYHIIKLISFKPRQSIRPNPMLELKRNLLVKDNITGVQSILVNNTWKVPPINDEEFFDIYNKPFTSNETLYARDSKTTFLFSSVSEQECEADMGIICKVKNISRKNLYIQNFN